MSATSLPRKRGERMTASKRVWLYGRMGAVVITSMTRLCRNFLDTYAYINRLQELGVGLVSIKDQVTLTAPAVCF